MSLKPNSSVLPALAIWLQPALEHPLYTFFCFKPNIHFFPGVFLKSHIMLQILFLLFCYIGGRVRVIPSNVPLLSAAFFCYSGMAELGTSEGRTLTLSSQEVGWMTLAVIQPWRLVTSCGTNEVLSGKYVNWSLVCFFESKLTFFTLTLSGRCFFFSSLNEKLICGELVWRLPSWTSSFENINSLAVLMI